jgi:hypothetical protein
LRYSSPALTDSGFQMTRAYSDVILAIGQKHYVLYWCWKEAARIS